MKRTEGNFPSDVSGLLLSGATPAQCWQIAKEVNGRCDIFFLKSRCFREFFFSISPLCALSTNALKKFEMTLWNKQLVLEQRSACNQSHAPSYKMHGQSSSNKSELSTMCNGQLLICVIFYKTCLVFILFLVPWLAKYQCLNKTVLLSAASRSLTSPCVRAVFCHYLTGGRDTV